MEQKQKLYANLDNSVCNLKKTPTNIQIQKLIDKEKMFSVSFPTDSQASPCAGFSRAVIYSG